MKKPSPKSDPKDTVPKNANLKGAKLTAKRGKAEAHNAPEKRTASKYRE